MDSASIARWGEDLHRAHIERVPIAPIVASEPEISIEDAYAIQNALIERRMKTENAHVIGRKIGVTSKAVQTLLNVHQPDFGHLLSTMVCDDGGTIDTARLISPRVEGELAFLLKHDLAGPGITPADVMRATECVMPCLEIVDSRIVDWKISIVDTVADNASSGMFVLGSMVADPRKIDLALVGMTLRRNGQIAGTGAGAAALGHPLNSVAWLANTLGRFGIELKSGEIVLSGALSSLVAAEAGDNFSVSIGDVGTAVVNFVGGCAHGA